MNFEKVKFKGTFRSYQQRVLDNSEEFLKDRKINIVAAPGSGKTILGLELICRLGNACIVFSPTTTIRQQWGERFCEAFLPSEEKSEQYISYDLQKVSLITSVTYQALYSAIEKIATATEEETVDYSNVELFALMKVHNIKTVCLDEAHHLQNEWQKALEKFIKALADDVTVISLTATPPYDANATEWGRYVSVCGEIDDEIFVPELVKEKTLCPHQDYVVFNYPSERENSSILTQRQNSNLALAEIASMPTSKEFAARLDSWDKQNPDYIYQNRTGVISWLSFAARFSLEPSKKILFALTGSHNFPSFDFSVAEKAVSFMLGSPLLSTAEKNNLWTLLKRHNLVERGKITFDLTDKLKRQLISSCGKLTSIEKIVQTESSSLKEKLRMLILTDYIKKESVANIGTDVSIDNLSVVSIFETLRRANPNAKLACLSGSLVILPKQTLEKMTESGIGRGKIKYSQIPNTEFVNVGLACQNRDKVALVSQLFEQGEIEVLIGTQSLLGEGWDSPCINSLILASYVGSFMLSNQMRGRAIRTYRNNPSKTANIWHLVTVEPCNNTEKLQSCDYETLCRRFDCFVGPNYETGEIESGIDRITYIQPPYDKKNLEETNNKTFAKAQDRESLCKVWQTAVATKGDKTVLETAVPNACQLQPFGFINILTIILVGVLESLLGWSLVHVILAFSKIRLSVLALVLIVVAMVAVIALFRKLLVFVIKHRNPMQSVKSMATALLVTLQELGFVREGATIKIDCDDDNIFVLLSICNATIHEQNVFHQAVKQMLSPIDNPRYVIIFKNIFGKPDYKKSFACPSVICKNENAVNVASRNFRKIGDVQLVYCYNENGRKIALRCKKQSFITQNDKILNSKYVLSD